MMLPSSISALVMALADMSNTPLPFMTASPLMLVATVSLVVLPIKICPAVRVVSLRILALVSIRSPLESVPSTVTLVKALKRMSLPVMVLSNISAVVITSVAMLMAPVLSMVASPLIVTA